MAECNRPLLWGTRHVVRRPEGKKFKEFVAQPASHVLSRSPLYPLHIFEKYGRPRYVEGARRRADWLALRPRSNPTPGGVHLRGDEQCLAARATAAARAAAG